MKEKAKELLFNTLCHIHENYELANNEHKNMQLKRVYLDDFFYDVETYCSYCAAFYALGIFSEEEKDDHVSFVYSKYM